MGTPVSPWLRNGGGSSPSTPNRPRQTPQSDYTAAVAAGGLGALKEARQQRRYGVMGAEQNYADTGVFSYNQPVARPGDPYDQWLASMTPQAQSGPYAYGQTEDGAYAGFKNEGTLKAAIRGRAEQRRAMDRDVFGSIDMMAMAGLNDLEQQYAARRQENTDTERYARKIGTLDDMSPVWSDGGMLGGTDRATFDARNQAEAMRPLLSDRNATPEQRRQAMTARANMGDVLPDSTGEGLNRADSAAANRYTGMAEMQAKTDYVNQDLNPWLGESSAPLLEQQDFAQSVLSTPIATYAQQAGAEYGVDPMIVAGWYPERSAITDARDQRDLQFLQQTGMTAAEYDRALADLERQNTTAAQQQATTQEEADAQAIDQYGLEQTGGVITTTALADQVNLPTQEVVTLLDSEAYQIYSADINDALNTRDQDTINETMTSVLDDAAYTDPALLNVLQVVYKDYIPPDYEFLG